MTWRLPVSVVTLTKIVRRATVVLVSAGIFGSVGFVVLPAPDPQPRCAALFTQALASPDRPIHGAFACLSSDFQFRAAMSGYGDDAGLQRLASAPPVVSNPRLIGHAGPDWIYEFAGAPPQVGIFSIDGDGHVSAFGLSPER